LAACLIGTLIEPNGEKKQPQEQQINGKGQGKRQITWEKGQGARKWRERKAPYLGDWRENQNGLENGLIGGGSALLPLVWNC